MNQNELLPCPFCGGKAFSVHNISTDTYNVFCFNAECCASDPSKYYSTLEKAIAAWNKRVETDIHKSEEKPITKADRTRAMTDEELAKLSIQIAPELCSYDFVFRSIFTNKPFDNEKEAIKDTIKWLQSEAD
jgi:Lar family restriction alleviation protein